VCADARALPLPDQSVDVLHANLCVQWCGPPQPLFEEFARVLKPGGFLAASSLGPDTLKELRAAQAGHVGGQLLHRQRPQHPAHAG
jgi:malonyl-CoA O-methyltransferase